MNFAISDLIGPDKTWAMSPRRFATYLKGAHMATAEAIEAAKAAAVAYESSPPSARILGDVAVIPMCGPITYKPDWFSMYFGGATIRTMQAQLRASLADPAVKSIVFLCDSPGGEVTYLSEFADEMWAAVKQGDKPIVAVADTMIASAAYYLASQCSQIFVTRSSQIGSVGCYTMHEDISGMLEQIGVKITLIAYGENKVSGNPWEALPEDVAAKWLADVTEYGKEFDAACARGRGVTTKVVRDTFGQGDVFRGAKAIELGMADKIMTWDQVIAKASKGKISRAAVSTTVIKADAVPAIAKKADSVEPVDPDEDGTCPEGYEKDEDDGLCYLSDGEKSKKKALAAPVAVEEPVPDVPAQEATEQAAAVAQAQLDADVLTSTLALMSTPQG